MKLRITIDLENEAFKPHAVDEIDRILRDYVKPLALLGDPNCPLIDINGNTVGKSEILKD